MQLRIFQKGFNYSQDGPGNRLVYHLQGCNMHCPWCCNPDGIPMAGAIVVNSGLLLERLCPYGAIRGQTLDRAVCSACEGRPCLAFCSEGIRLSYTEYETGELLREALSSRPLFIDGGGVTFTGGEATCQFDPLKEFLALLREEKINTAIETNGTHPRLRELLPLLGAVIMDIKHWDGFTLHNVTGADPAMIFENLAQMTAEGVPLQLRIPLINGFNASDEDLEGFLRLFSSIDMGNSTLEFLEFHEYGLDKWAACGMAYTMSGGHVDQETVRRFREAFKKQGVHVVKT